MAISDKDSLEVRQRPLLISGPCAAESLEVCLSVGRFVKERAEHYGYRYIFKASFDKANRTSLTSYRGPGMQKGLEILDAVKRELGVPVLTDIHLPSQAAPVAEVVDYLQIPAFLCRQTDLIAAAAKTGKPTNIKKGQFLAPESMRHAVAKYRESGGVDPMVTERGTMLGYGHLVVDMRNFSVMRKVCNAPVIFDATHSAQKPSTGTTTGGNRKHAVLLARAATAAGIDGIFAEVHPDPENALSDGPNSLDFELLETMLRQCSGCADALASSMGG